MRLNIYAIYDKAVNAYMRPFFLQADGQAMRAFGDMANDKDHDIGRHPEDFSLFRIGSFDDNSGEIEVIDAQCLGRAHEIARKES